MTTFKHLQYPQSIILALLLSLLLGSLPLSAEIPAGDSALFNSFPRVALLVKEQYVDPERISPDAMLASILESLEQRINKLVITLPKSLSDALERSKKPEGSTLVKKPDEKRALEKGSALNDQIVLDFGGAKKIVPYEHLRSIWGMVFMLRSIFNFVETQAKKQGLLVKSKTGEEPLDWEKIESTAINAMLATLDPHSIYLEPTYARDLTLTTKGEFGGVGIVISVREGALTVISPIDGTPAAIAGVKAKDRIIKVDEESAINMPLDKAVTKLRGAPNSTVSITVQRSLPSGPKEFEFKLKRSIIKVESVAYTLLDNDVGYLRIKAFQGNTAADVKHAILEMKKKSHNKMSGIVIDLRDNPGGLLREAVTISDFFLSSGEIVSTQGAQKDSRQVEMATGGELDPKLKIAVLINGGSASASEIVGAAIKYGGPNASDPEEGRGILIGDSSTFGKGSVQMLFDFPNKNPKNEKGAQPVEPAALKLTIAQYYGPQDRIIQTVGIAPDILITPVTAAKAEELSLFPNKSRQEKDLDAHLSAVKSREEKPELKLDFLAPLSSAEENEYGRLDVAKLKKEFAIKVATDFIQSSSGPTRKDMLANQAQIKDRLAQEEQKKIIAALKKYKIDWSSGRPMGKADALKLELKSSEEVQAGEKLKVVVAVKNTSDRPAYQVHAITHSKTDIFDQREFIFGKLEPNQQIERAIEFDIPKDVITRKDLMTLELRDIAQEKLEELNVPLSIKGLKRPRLAYLVYIDDEKGGNGDGKVQEGEEVNLVVWLKNMGEGKAFEPTILLKNESGPKIFLEKGRETAKELLPNQETSMTFSFRVKEPIDAADFEIQIFDGQMHDVWRDKISLPIQAKGPAMGRKRNHVVLNETKLLANAFANSPARAFIRDGQHAEILGESTSYYLVKIAKNLVGFVNKSDIKEMAKNPTQSEERLAEKVQINYERVPAKIDLKFADGHGWTTKESGDLVADITNAKKVSELLLFVNGKKVLYKPLNMSKDTDKITQKITLKPGMNVISLVAKENAEFGQRENLTVYYEDKGLIIASPKKVSPTPKL